MSTGIVSYGVYLPRRRLSREAIRVTLGQGGGKGTQYAEAIERLYSP